MSKRSIQNRIESLEGGTTDTAIFAFELADGGYVDASGSPIEDFESVLLTLPPSVWDEWETTPV